MGVIVNPRGTSGSGKTELVRRIMAGYGWRRDRVREGYSGIEPIYRAGRGRPFGYRLQHPFGGRPLAVLGHYEATSGGCDTIREVDGGLREILRSAGEHASAGYDVLVEGLRLSSEVEFSRELAQSHGLHILRLSTPLDQCVRNLVSRRRARRDAVPLIERNTIVEHRRVDEACTRLARNAAIEVLSFDEALERAQDLLGLRISRMVA
jgi:hypothetical protein